MANEQRQRAKSPAEKLIGKGHLSDEARKADLGPEYLHEAREKGYIGVVPDDSDYSVSAVLRDNFAERLDRRPKEQLEGK